MDANIILPGGGDGRSYSEIGQASSLEDEFASKTSLSEIGQASNLEDEFASKTSLLAGGGCENFSPTAEDSEEFSEEYSQDSDDSDESDDLIIYQGSSDDSDEEQGTFLQKFSRRLVKEGQEVKLPANMWYIRLKDGPPEGCDPIANHLNLLKQVVGSDANEVYTDAFSDTKLSAILTDEEHEKLSGMEQVESSCIIKCWLEIH